MSADKLPESVQDAILKFEVACCLPGTGISKENPIAAGENLEAAVLAYARERERETIERCAVVCLSVGANEPDNRVAEVCADKIRALLPPEEKQT